MKKRQEKKVLKRAGGKIHKDLPLSSVEDKYVARKVESLFLSSLHRLQQAEYEAGTIYGNGYMERLSKMLTEATSIEKVTGVHQLVVSS